VPGRSCCAAYLPGHEPNAEKMSSGPASERSSPQGYSLANSPPIATGDLGVPHPLLDRARGRGQRYLSNRPMPLALPLPTEADKQKAKPGAPTQPGAPLQRPAIGPVVPLTTNNVQSEELLGGGRTVFRTPAGDATASRVLNKGEPVPAARGRADDFNWPRSGIEIDESAVENPPSPTPTTVGSSVPATQQQQPERNAGQTKPALRPARSGTNEGPLRSLQQMFPGLFRF
jgi:hypothetical protein